MQSSRALIVEVGERIPDILSDWQTLTGVHPWLQLPDDLDLDHLPDLVRALIDTCVGRHEAGDPKRRVVEAGLKHGRHRTGQDYPDHLLFREYHLLREAIWRGMHRRHPHERETVSAISRIDAAITAATRASLQGYHRKTWDDEVVEKLVRESAWPEELSRGRAPEQR